MRALRLSLVGTVILAFAGEVGTATWAQTESDTPASTGSALLSFTLPYPEPSTPGVVETADGRRFIHEGVFQFTLDSGDPRLSGELWTINSYYTFLDSGGSVWVGFVGLDDEGGAWRGTFHGYGTQDNERTYLQVDLTGSDAYDGLSAILFATDNGTGFDVDGMVFPGELPPMPEKEEPSAETGPMAPAFFTFTTRPVDQSAVPEGTELGDDWDMQMVDATDPRASGLVAISANSTMIRLDEGAVMTALMSERLTNDGGAWSGTGRFVMAGSEDGGVMASMDVLTGEGGYEGLTLIIGQFEDGGAMTNWGVIVPSDQVPPMPDPIEPSTR